MWIFSDCQNMKRSLAKTWKRWSHMALFGSFQYSLKLVSNLYVTDFVVCYIVQFKIGNRKNIAIKLVVRNKMQLHVDYDPMVVDNSLFIHKSHFYYPCINPLVYNLPSWHTCYHRGRWTEIKEYLYWSHIENDCSFSLYLKFVVSKWKCDFILSFLIQVLVLYSKIQKSWDGAKKIKLLLQHFGKQTQ